MNNRSLSIQEWHQMAMEGKAPPVRIQLNGYSMFPLVRKGMDYVTIIPLDRELILGDIVLFFEPDTGRYVVHRVWEVREGQVLTWGDHCEVPDRWNPLEMIWKSIRIRKKGCDGQNSGTRPENHMNDMKDSGAQ